GQVTTSPLASRSCRGRPPSLTSGARCPKERQMSAIERKSDASNRRQIAEVGPFSARRLYVQLRPKGMTMSTEHRVLIESFADARRTWDDLVALQPDVKAGSGHLDEPDLIELEQRIEAHRMAIDMLVDAVEAEPSDTPDRRVIGRRRAGINDREY